MDSSHASVTNDAVVPLLFDDVARLLQLQLYARYDIFFPFYFIAIFSMTSLFNILVFFYILQHVLLLFLFYYFSLSMTKKSRKMKDLPNECIGNFFTNLLAKSLRCFKCLSKTWCKKIEDSNFVMEQMQNKYRKLWLLILK